MHIVGEQWEQPVDTTTAQNVKPVCFIESKIVIARVYTII